MFNGDTTVPTSAEASMLRNAQINAQPGNRKRITIRQEGLPSESLWATRIEENRYRLDNAPLFVDEVYFADIVTAKPDEANANVLLLNEVVESADYSAIVSIGKFHLPEMQKGIKTLEKHGIVVEQWDGYLAVLSVPSDFTIPVFKKVFGMKKPPIALIAPPGPWLVDVVASFAKGDQVKGSLLLERERREFLSAHGIPTAPLKTGALVDAEAAEITNR